MLKVTVIAVGKIKDRWITSGIDEYSKRLGAYCNLNIVELAEAKISQNPSSTEIERLLDKEAELILNNISARAKVFALCIEGEQCSSAALASNIATFSQTSPELVFIIGSSHGLSPKIKELAAIKLSFSLFTFPHQLMRLILTEQLYRAFSIINNSSYHK